MADAQNALGQLTGTDVPGASSTQPPTAGVPRGTPANPEGQPGDQADQRVPYDRFKAVNDERDQLRQQNADMQKQLEQHGALRSLEDLMNPEKMPAGAADWSEDQKMQHLVREAAKIGATAATQAVDQGAIRKMLAKDRVRSQVQEALTPQQEDAIADYAVKYPDLPGTHAKQLAMLDRPELFSQEPAQPVPAQPAGVPPAHGVVPPSNRSMPAPATQTAQERFFEAAIHGNQRAKNSALGQHIHESIIAPAHAGVDPVSGRALGPSQRVIVKAKSRKRGGI